MDFGVARFLFVYGTLLPGEGNHGLLARAKAHGRAVTLPQFEMFDLGAYPAAMSGGTTSLVGQLFEVDDCTLQRIDVLEGHPDYYVRSAVELIDGRSAELYLLTTADAEGCPRIVSGDWQSRRRERLQERQVGS